MAKFYRLENYPRVQFLVASELYNMKLKNLSIFPKPLPASFIATERSLPSLPMCYLFTLQTAIKFMSTVLSLKSQLVIL